MQHGEGQALALREGAAFFYRSAGACPPRSLDRADDIETRESYKGHRQTMFLGPTDLKSTRDVFLARAMARACPSCYGEGAFFSHE